MRLILPALILAICILCAPNAQAQQGLEPTPPDILRNFVREGGQIFFLGEYEGMNGWVLIRNGQPEYFYENPDGTALVMGLLFDTDGQMVTMPQLSRLRERVGDDMYATTGRLNIQQEPVTTDITGQDVTQQPQVPDIASVAEAMMGSPNEAVPPTTATPEQETLSSGLDFATPVGGVELTPAEQMFVDLIRANWVTMNPEGNHDMFALIDPNCSHCKEFILNSNESFLEAGDLRLRIIPIGMNIDSARRSAVLLASADPVKRLIEFSNGNEEALPAPNNINIEAVEGNTALMVKHNFGVTPAIVYRTKQGKIRLIRGRPADYNNILRDIREN